MASVRERGERKVRKGGRGEEGWEDERIREGLRIDQGNESGPENSCARRVPYAAVSVYTAEVSVYTAESLELRQSELGWTLDCKAIKKTHLLMYVSYCILI